MLGGHNVTIRLLQFRNQKSVYNWWISCYNIFILDSNDVCSGSYEDRRDGLLFRQCVLQISCPWDIIKIRTPKYVQNPQCNKMKTFWCPP